MKERFIAGVLTAIKKVLVAILIGFLFPIGTPILIIGVILWIYVPFYNEYMKEEKEKKRKKKDNN